MKNDLSWNLTPRQMCDLELLLDGSFSPLNGFLGEADFHSVLEQMRLCDGRLWPMPICLDVPREVGTAIKIGDILALRHSDGTHHADLHVSSLFEPKLEKEALQLFGTTDQKHPGVSYLLNRTRPLYVGGRVEAKLPIKHHDFVELRRDPTSVKAMMSDRGWSRVIAFQTRNPLHRVHHALITRAMKQFDAGVLIHPVVGLTRPGDVDHYSRVRCYKAMMPHFPEGKATLSLLNLAMRMGGPKEALWHALIRKNFGCTGLIVGRDHAGPGVDSAGRPFYGPYDAQEMLKAHSDEIGIEMIPFQEMCYSKRRSVYVERGELEPGEDVASISGTHVREMLDNGEPVPAWFTYPEVAEELQITYASKKSKGTVLFFTGLSGSGKSTIAHRLEGKLMERYPTPITMLDGDIVRLNLSKGLGFSKEDRDANVRRIGFVASEIARHGGTVMCAAIAPYQSVRDEVRQMAQGVGAKFVEIHVSTSLMDCEARDVKGLYAKARRGEIKGFTGIDDPYEEPRHPEINLDAGRISVEEACAAILEFLEE